MHFWLIYEVLFVGFMGPDRRRVCACCLWVFWVQTGSVYVCFLGPNRRICFIVGFCFTTSPKMKAPAEVADRIELKIRERREIERKDIILGHYFIT